MLTRNIWPRSNAIFHWISNELLMIFGKKFLKFIFSIIIYCSDGHSRGCWGSDHSLMMARKEIFCFKTIEVNNALTETMLALLSQYLVKCPPPVYWGESMNNFTLYQSQQMPVTIQLSLFWKQQWPDRRQLLNQVFFNEHLHLYSLT